MVNVEIKAANDWEATPITSGGKRHERQPLLKIIAYTGCIEQGTFSESDLVQPAMQATAANLII